MKKVSKKIIAFLLCAICVVCLPFSAYAGDSSVTYDGNAQKFIFAPGSEHSPSDLFGNFKSVMPGDSLTQKISVKNDVSNKVKIKVYLRSKGAKEGSEKFLSQMNLSVSQNGNSNMFSAPADQTAQLSDWVCLGTFYSGAEIDLNVKLNVPHEMNNEFQNAIGKLTWEFKVEELPVETTDPSLPSTGNFINTGKIAAVYCAAVAAGAAVLIVAKKKKKSESES